MKLTTFTLTIFLTISACAFAEPAASPSVANNQAKADDRTILEASGNAAPQASDPVQKEPKTVMDFFALLPAKYFLLEGCEPARDRDCRKARADYLKNYSEVEDLKNGYFKGGCDGGQRCIEMAIFRRPDGTYLVGVATFAEMDTDFNFLDYADGKWSDVGSQVIPEYSEKNWYEMPRVGTTMKVYARKYIEGPEDPDVSIRGELKYELSWKDGKFSKK